jgi:hypothetical protein
LPLEIDIGSLVLQLDLIGADFRIGSVAWVEGDPLRDVMDLGNVVGFLPMLPARIG